MPRPEFGANWWSRRWLAALEEFGYESRLRRGRSYARAGQVAAMDVKPGLVQARVKGSRPRPYSVQIHLPVLADQAWEPAIDALAGQARFTASLLAGEMPRDVDDLFREVGAHLFPVPGEDLETSCSCPDPVNPCKHVAAVHYVIGSELDRDPFLLFLLRGRPREAVLMALRARRAGAPAPDAAATAAGPTAATDGPPIETEIERFWQLGEEFGGLRFTIDAPRVPEAVLKRLGLPLDPRNGEQSSAELTRLYRTISERAMQSAYEDGEPGG
jgi:uncharacterized Zn finger protein